MEQFTREQWLALPGADIAVQVWDHKIGVLLTSDGTRRHYLLQHPEENGRISNYDAYMLHTAQLYMRAFEVLYRLGVYAILTPGLYSLNFQRGGRMLEFFLDSTRRSLLYPPFTEFYARWQTKTRLYGDYDIAPAAEPVRDGLGAVQTELIERTPDGERLLLFGYTGGTFHEEQIARTAALQAALNRPPTVPELRRACFPDGPEQVDIHIGGGWMRTGRVLPLILDDGATDLYFTTGLPLDITEAMMRGILYDHLYLRNVAPEDNADYTIQNLETLRDYYAAHGQGVIGLGRLVEPGLWYPE